MAFPLSDEEHDTIKSRIEEQEELIVSAAIQYKGINLTLDRPGRHGSLINFLWYHVGEKDHENWVEGFLTNRGRFVGREEAGILVLASGQGSPRTLCSGRLYSEDMWNDSDRFWEEEARKSPIDPAKIF